MSEQITPDPWLYPGCPCLVWDNNDSVKRLRFFKKVSGIGAFVFADYSCLYNHLSYDHYKPIGTPWDNAPPEAAFIRIDENGNCFFYINQDDVHPIYLTKTNIIPYIHQMIIIPWPACPEHLKEKTWQRPEWAKE